MRHGPSESSNILESTAIVSNRQGFLLRHCFVYHLARFATDYRPQVTLIKVHGGAISDLTPQLNGYRLAALKTLYYMPDHPTLLKIFVWQFKDCAPQYLKFHELLEY